MEVSVKAEHGGGLSPVVVGEVHIPVVQKKLSTTKTFCLEST